MKYLNGWLILCVFRVIITILLLLVQVVGHGILLCSHSNRNPTSPRLSFQKRTGLGIDTDVWMFETVELSTELDGS